MLQLIFAGAAVATVSYMLSDKEKKSKKKKKKKLKKQQLAYQEKLNQQYQHNQQKKQKKLFSLIKNEQTALKLERKKLSIIKKTLDYRSEEYKLINDEISALTNQIEHKQSDADKMRY